MRWITMSERPLTVVSHTVAPDDAHDPVRHAELLASPREFCGPLAMVDAIDIDGDTVSLRSQSWPYCRILAADPTDMSRPATLGWNTVMSVDGGTTLVVAHRSPLLKDGGRWHLTPAEGAEPTDMADAGPVDIGPVVSRSLREELGVDVDAASAAAGASVIAMFCASELSGYSFLIHVRGDDLGISGDDVLASHCHAVDGWEGRPALVAANRRALLEHAPRSEWVSWSLPCLGAVCDLLDGRSLSATTTPVT